MSKRPSKPSDDDTLWIIIGVILEIAVFGVCYYVLGAFDISEHTRGLISQFAFLAILLFLVLIVLIVTVIVWIRGRREQGPRTTRSAKSRRKAPGGKRKKRARE